MAKIKTAKKKSKKALPKKEYHKIYYTYSEYRSGGEPQDPEDPWTFHADTIVDWRLENLFLCQSANTPYWDSIPILGLDITQEIPKTLFVLIVRYSTGDTFGNTEGCGTVAAVSPNLKLIETLKEKINTGKDINDDFEGCYRPWNGYFERVQGCYIEQKYLGNK